MKKIIITTLSVFLTLLLCTYIPNPETDKKVFGAKFEKHIKDKYTHYLIDETFRKALEIGYDANEKQELIVHGDIVIDKYKDRYIYCHLEGEYNADKIVIMFKGEKEIGDRYSWSVLNEDTFSVLVKPNHDKTTL